MFVRVGDAPVVLFFEFVLSSIGRGVAALPESFDEVIALFVVGQLLERAPFFICDNEGDVLVQPLPVRLAQLLFERLRVLLFRFLAERPLEWIFLSFVARLNCLRVRIFIVFIVFLLRQGRTTQPEQGTDHQNAQETPAKTCGKHRRAYLARYCNWLILCSLDTPRQAKVAWG